MLLAGLHVKHLPWLLNGGDRSRDQESVGDPVAAFVGGGVGGSSGWTREQSPGGWRDP